MRTFLIYIHIFQVRDENASLSYSLATRERVQVAMMELAAGFSHLYFFFFLKTA